MQRKPKGKTYTCRKKCGGYVFAKKCAGVRFFLRGKGKPCNYRPTRYNRSTGAQILRKNETGERTNMKTLLIKNIASLVSCDEQDRVYENVDLYAEDGVI